MAVSCSLRSLPAQRFRRTLVDAAHFVAAALLVLSFGVRANASEWITTAAAVHNLSRADAAQGRAVHLAAAVTYYDPARHLLFVQDKSGGVFIRTTRPYPVQVGDLVDVLGVTEPSYRGDVAADPTIRIIGRRPLPTPMIVEPGETAQLAKGKWDSQRVTLRGVVRSALIDPNYPDQLDLDLLVDGSVMQASVLHARNSNPAELIDSEVAVTGTLGANFNAKLQFICLSLYSNHQSDLKLLRRASSDPGSLPLTPVGQVLNSQSVIDHAQRVHLRGTVTYYHPGRTIVIQQDGSTVSGTTWQRTAAPLGSVVDVSGFAYQGEFGPVLKEVMFRLTGQTKPVVPTRMAYDQAMTGIFNDELVSVRGRILSQNHGETSDTLTLLVDRHPITVDLQEPVDGRWLPSLRVGSEVEVTGICRVTLTTNWDRPRSLPAFFRIDLRSADDIRVLSQPSWWTLDHLLKLFALVCFLSLVLTLWAVALRRRVLQQTAMLKGSMRLEQERSRMLQAISSDGTLGSLLEDLCATCEALMPHVQCGCSVVADEHLGVHAIYAGCAFDDHHDLPVFAQRMKDGHGSLFGHFRVRPHQRRALTKDEREVFDVFAGLATLAVNQRRMYQELNYTSTHDQLTGLPNRRLADSCLELALQQQSTEDSMVAVVYIDLDHFKQVNDQYGHKTGDQYLQLIATRMGGAVRSTDMLARVGGDEFLLIASDVTELEEAERYRSRLAACFAEPFLLDGVTLTGAASIGVAVAPEHGRSAEELKRKADLDMYAAKHHHRTGTHLRTVSLEREMYSVADLELAMREGRFQLFYQPQFCADGTLRGLEALLRLDDPVHGIVAPDAFIGIAERNDIIHALGAWVLREALTDAMQWGLPLLNTRMMVNISIRQAEHQDFAASVLRIIEDSGVPPDCVELEITERMLMHDMPEAITQLGRLRKRGVHVAIDDFGVEHSCLSVLHNLPFDTLKLDRTFIRAMNENSQATHIVSAIVAMANSLGKRVVAEGVETKAHVQSLAPFGGVDLQGYYFSRPRPADEIARALKTWGPAALTDGSPPEVDVSMADAMLSSPR